ncbi:MAG: hypothetical protein KHZ72_07350 [Lachnospiraceae bacterium]|nr:hypothetical protein [Lachnospiraceae bacterium]
MLKIEHTKSTGKAVHMNMEYVRNIVTADMDIIRKLMIVSTNMSMNTNMKMVRKIMIVDTGIPIMDMEKIVAVEDTIINMNIPTI